MTLTPATAYSTQSKRFPHGSPTLMSGKCSIFPMLLAEANIDAEEKTKEP
jgi:hypothetical protein